MIIFNCIRWQNLLSTGNVFTEVRLDKARTTLIIGSNGAGKSTILDAICFVLFNKPFRKVNKGQLINSVTNKALLVEIEFEKGGVQWMVRRGSKPNVFEIFKNGELVDQNSSNQDYLESTVLGMNQKAFTQIVILGAASFVPFMQLTVPIRREVIEDFMDIQVFSDMNKLLLKRNSANRDRVSDVNSKHTLIKSQVAMGEEFNRKRKEDTQTLIDAKKAKVDELVKVALDTVEKMEAEQAALANIQFDTKSVDILNARKRDLENDNIVRLQEIKNSEKVVGFLNRHDTCPTCAQSIATDFKINELHNHESNISMMIEIGKTQHKEISEITAKLSELFEFTKQTKKHEAMIVEYEREIGWYQQQVENLTTEIDGMKSANEVPMKDLSELYASLWVVETEVNEATQESNVLAVASALLKDNGIKSVIIKQYIPVVNSLINKYLAEMDFFVDFQLNEAFEETIKSRFRDEFSYESFSEGEKMRIDLAILFAWREVAKQRNSTATNLLIFDEVLDSSLDPAGVEEFLKIIKSMTDHENIFVISHRGDTIGDKFDDVLKFNRVRGFSQMEEGNS